MKINVVQIGEKNPFGTIYALVTEVGEILYTHVCSDESFAKGDLYDNRPERQEYLKKRFGSIEKGW